MHNIFQVLCIHIWPGVQVIVQDREHSELSHEALLTGSLDELTTLKWISSTLFTAMFDHKCSHPWRKVVTTLVCSWDVKMGLHLWCLQHVLLGKSVCMNTCKYFIVFYIYCRASPSCTHISALLQALVAMTPTTFQLQLSSRPSLDLEEESLPVTFYSCQWKPPRKQKQSNLPIAEAILRNMCMAKPKSDLWRQLKTLVLDQSNTEGLQSRTYQIFWTRFVVSSCASHYSWILPFTTVLHQLWKVHSSLLGSPVKLTWNAPY